MLSGPTTARDSFGGLRVKPAPDQRPLMGQSLRVQAEFFGRGVLP